MNIRNRFLAAGTLLALWGAALAGCAPVAAPRNNALSEADKRRILAEEMERAGRTALAAPAPRAAPPGPPGPPPPPVKDPLDASVTLNAAGAPLGAVLARLAEQAGLRLVTDRDIKLDTPVTAAAREQRMREVLRTVLVPLDYSFRAEEGALVVYQYETEIWTASLPVLTLSSTTTITNETGGMGTTGEGGGSPSTGSLSGVNLGARALVGTKAEGISTWEELEKVLAGMVSKDGRLALNRTLGLITVRDRPDRLQEISRFLARHEAQAAEQVSVSVKALEVSLSASDQYGIDWSRVWTDLIGTTDLRVAGGFATPLTLPLSLAVTERGRLDLLVRALSTQGEVKVITQPSIRLLNGHPAVIQVGRVQAFVAESAQTVAGTTGTSTFTLKLGSVQDGVILPITARVMGEDIIMNVSPIVSRVRQIRRVTSGTTTVEAPDVDNRALQTTVRLRSGETVVLGGLISSDEADTRSGLPILLRAVPVLGWLLGSLDQRSGRTEVVLTLTPTLVRRPGAPGS